MVGVNRGGGQDAETAVAPSRAWNCHVLVCCFTASVGFGSVATSRQGQKTAKSGHQIYTKIAATHFRILIANWIDWVIQINFSTFIHFMMLEKFCGSGILAAVSIR